MLRGSFDETKKWEIAVRGLLISVAAILVLATPLGAFAQRRAVVQLTAMEGKGIAVSPHVHVMDGWPNTGIVVGDTGILVVDTGLGPANGAVMFREASKRATKGQKLYEYPKWSGAVRAQIDPVEFLSLGVQGKFVGDRWTNLTNTEKFNGYALWDLDARVKLESFGLKNTYIQGNIRNLFDERYLGDIATNPSGTGLGTPGYRRTYSLTLHVEY